MSQDNAQVIPFKQNMIAGAKAQGIVPTSFEEAWRFTELLSKAQMLPKGMNKEQGMVAILQGLEVGLSPMASVQSIAVVNGRPTIWGDAVIGLIRGSGLCEKFNEWQETDSKGELTAYCESTRKGGETVKRSFSQKEAVTAGLWGKTGVWQQYKPRMLQMRARGFAARDLYADVLRGLQVREEVEDYNENLTKKEIKDITPPPPPAQSISADTKPQTPQPPVDIEKKKAFDMALFREKLESCSSESEANEILNINIDRLSGDTETIAIITKMFDNLMATGCIDE